MSARKNLRVFLPLVAFCFGAPLYALSPQSATQQPADGKQGDTNQKGTSRKSTDRNTTKAKGPMRGPVSQQALDQARANIAAQPQGAQGASSLALKKTATLAERKQYAQTLEGHLLSIGLDAHVRAVGKEGTTLRISWAAMSRPVVYNMINGEGMQEEVPALGFRRVVFTDDGSFSGSSVETWTYRWNGTRWTQ